ncbi:MAG: hypothetical protein HY673_04035 [Chloroflexi bacterium]|nr:hypothetical protein [Chloroflexota bacterium]
MGKTFRLRVVALLLAVALAVSCAPDQAAVQSPTPSPTPPLPTPASVRAAVVLEPAHLALRSGETGEVNIFIKNVAALYGAEVHLSFDPALLSPLDGYPDTPGLQLVHGTLIDRARGFVAQNQADAAAGAADYAVVLVPPAAPVSGEGVLATLRFRAIEEGTTPVRIRDSKLAQLAGGSVIPIPHSTAPATVVVSR